ncbi:uncharacterized protein [Anoplolepis gracilipes]|uniref:uncharacterized protein isoform X2 n=1 Tax=Anoplolepis gracilipes TaxID=354296 RepID=UPI003BA0E8D7
MDKHVKTIKYYYTNLGYDINKKVALKRISDLSLKLIFQDPNNFANRLNETASIMQDNFFLFASVCKHKDIITSIINYLKHFGVQFMYDMYGEYHDKFEVIPLLMCTIYNINVEREVLLFLEKAIIENSKADDFTHVKFRTIILNRNIEMILLEEADLYAVINCLKIEDVSSLSKIWVHESIKQTFQLHIIKNFEDLSVPIYIFQSKRELLTAEILIDSQLRILSIWSEDIVTARNLAMSVKNQHVIFINTHMNFCAGILLPYGVLYDLDYSATPRIKKIMDEKYKCIISSHINIKLNEFSKFYELFYNGTWQKPLQQTYFHWIDNNILLADATREDVMRCKESALKGFKIWSAESINSRMAVLFRLALILESKGEFLLADTVSKWLKLPYFCINTLTRHETEQFEITKVRQPRSVVLLEEKDNVTMFRELTQTLIAGNSIIVMCNPDLCTLAPYCDVFSTARIPPGVINLLSTTHKEYSMADLTKLNPGEVYSKLTMNNTRSPFYVYNRCYEKITINLSKAFTSLIVEIKLITSIIIMYKRVKVINKCYTRLEYKDNKSEALEKISTLSKELKFKDTHDFSHRFHKTATLIKRNLKVFMAGCEHIDVITTIVDYLIYFAVNFKIDNASEIKSNDEIIILIMLTIYNMYKDDVIQLFLETVIIKESQLQIYNNYKAIIHKIWIQESREQIFKWFLKKYVEDLHIKLYTFRSRQELLILDTSEYNVHIVSIWSEDITAAKKLAESLNQHVVFINSYMDFCPGIVLPYKDIYCKSPNQVFNLREVYKRVYTNPIDPTAHKGLLYDLFYDGMWQKPKKNTYWIHNNILLANATCVDIVECINSAEKGFKICSTMSSDSKKEMLSKFAHTLECTGKFLLAKIVLELINRLYFNRDLIKCYQTERFEVIKTRKPQGITILQEMDGEVALFYDLIENIIIGNSVIVICNPDLCILASYCDMFKMCGIPPGVINLLSSENTDFRYDNVSTLTNQYESFSIVKHIVVSRK